MLENDRERKKDDKKENRGIILSGIEYFLIEVLCLGAMYVGADWFLGDAICHIGCKGKSKPFRRVNQALLNGRLLQSIAADRTVHCNGLYSLL